MLRGRKRHINIWHTNNFSVTPVTLLFCRKKDRKTTQKTRISYPYRTPKSLEKKGKRSQGEKNGIPKKTKEGQGWHINNFSVTPVTDPPGRAPGSSRPGTRTKMFMFLGFRTQHINFWPLATGRETPGHPVGRPPAHPGSHRKNLLCVCAFSFPECYDVLIYYHRIFRDRKKGSLQKGSFHWRNL